MYRVAFTGPAGSGKTTHARLLQKKFGGDVLSFATPLKKVTHELFGDRMEDEVFARTANQELGLAVRHLDINTWVKLLVAKVSTNRNCYVDDCRFPNEYEALRELGFLVVRCTATVEDLASRRPALTVEQRRHQSETESAYISFDNIINTSYSTEEENTTALVAWLKTLHQEEKTHAAVANS